MSGVGATGASQGPSDVGYTAADMPGAPAAPLSATSAEVQQSIVAMADVFTLMFAMSAEQERGQSIDARNKIELNGDQRKRAIEAAKAAIEAARKAAAEQKEAAGFWGSITETFSTIGKVAAVVAVAASVVASGGLSAPAALAVAGLVISMYGKEALVKVGVGEQAAGLIAAGAAIACNVTSFATATGQAAGTLQTAAQVGKTTAVAADGLAAGSEGIGDGVSAGYDREIAHHKIDGKVARARQRKLQRQVEQMVDALKDLNKSFNRAKSALVDAQQQHHEASSQAVQFGRA